MLDFLEEAPPGSPGISRSGALFSFGGGGFFFEGLYIFVLTEIFLFGKTAPEMGNNNNLQEKVLEHLLSSGFGYEDTIREVDLAGIFGVSVTPIREVLNNLEEKGFVERKKRKGTYLKPFSLKELSELYELRSVLEGLAAKLLCEVVTPDVVSELKTLSEEYEQNKPGRKRAVLSNIDYRFHSKIVESCGNERLKIQIKESHAITKFFMGDTQNKYVSKIALKNPYTHVRIVSAVDNADGAQAERLMRKHVEWAKDNMLKFRIANSCAAL